MTNSRECVERTRKMLAESQALIEKMNDEAALYQIEMSRRLIEEAELLLHRLRLMQAMPWWSPRWQSRR